VRAQRATQHQDDEARGKAENLREPSRWQRRAACRESAPALFFPPGNSHLTRADEEQAKAVCSSCPVRTHCLASAIEHEEAHGVWGGLNPEERQALTATGATIGA
jgi:WhiB family transcriptional regulator, redox-sensing transcriptional regulator